MLLLFLRLLHGLELPAAKTSIHPYDQVVRCSDVFGVENRREIGSLLTHLVHPICSRIMSAHTCKSLKQSYTRFSYCYCPVASR